jgi:hypothetical protein
LDFRDLIGVDINIGRQVSFLRRYGDFCTDYQSHGPIDLYRILPFIFLRPVLGNSSREISVVQDLLDDFNHLVLLNYPASASCVRFDRSCVLERVA